MVNLNLKISSAILFKQNSKLKIVNLNSQILRPYDVLVKIKYTGVCKSQLMEINGIHNTKKYIPHMLGHEASGIVLKIGSKVKKVKIGQKVILSWIKGRGGDNGPKKIFKENLKISAGSITTFSNYSVISENRVFIKPKKMNDKEAAFYGCAVLTGGGIILNEMKPKKNSSVAIIGLGGIGYVALKILQQIGVKNIVCIDNNPKKIRLSKNLGIKHNINSLSKNFKKKFIKIFPNGVDYCIECAGLSQTIEMGFDLLSKNGSLFFSSHPKNSDKIKISPFDLIKGKKIYGSWGGSCKPDRDINKIFNILEKKPIFSKKNITKTFDLSKINNAILALKKGKVLRPLIKMKH
jgi:S-(hydroxymethyl)glutathione dehydrogenase/alcohol dehydrogenase